MESVNLNQLIEKVQKNNILLVIDEDLTEGIYKIDNINDNLEDLIKGTVGCCFNLINGDCFIWKYLNDDNYEITYIDNEIVFYLHDKVKNQLGELDKIECKK
ncbi:MAG: hypothetical protein ACTSRP_11995 [Candidatus Helarchaeota archaeon]